jgi:hypothetical protein
MPLYSLSGIFNIGYSGHFHLGGRDVSIYNGHFPVYPIFPCTRDSLSLSLSVCLSFCLLSSGCLSLSMCVSVCVGVYVYVWVCVCACVWACEYVIVHACTRTCVSIGENMCMRVFLLVLINEFVKHSNDLNYTDQTSSLLTSKRSALLGKGAPEGWSYAVQPGDPFYYWPYCHACCCGNVHSPLSLDIVLDMSLSEKVVVKREQDTENFKIDFGCVLGVFRSVLNFFFF